MPNSTPHGAGRAVETGHALSVSGRPDRDGAHEVPTGIEAQTHRAFDDVEAVLSAAGYGLDAVAKVTCYLVDPQADFEAFVGVWNDRLGDVRPCRTVVGVESLANPAFRVELDVAVAPET